MLEVLLATALFLVGALAYYAFGMPGTVGAILAGALIGYATIRKNQAHGDRTGRGGSDGSEA